MTIRDRIIDFRRVKASELRPSPHNWRSHPKGQQEALRGVLAEIGAQLGIKMDEVINKLFAEIVDDKDSLDLLMILSEDINPDKALRKLLKVK